MRFHHVEHDDMFGIGRPLDGRSQRCTMTYIATFDDGTELARETAVYDRRPYRHRG